MERGAALSAEERRRDGPEIIWAPWRSEYVGDEDARQERPGCVFCDLPERGDDEAAYILHRGKGAYVVMNLYPYNPGHVMVVPFAHVQDLGGLGDDLPSEMIRLAQTTERILSEALRPHGFNVGINIGRAGGAGIADHLHMHVLPRWTADTNFLTSLADARVIPLGLDETYSLLSKGFAS